MAEGLKSAGVDFEALVSGLRALVLQGADVLRGSQD